METAFVLVSFGTFDDKDGLTRSADGYSTAIKQLKALPYVKELTELFEEYSAIIKIEGKDFKDIGEKVQEMRKVEDIYNFKTLTGINLEQWNKTIPHVEK
ncbi:MAG: hypothetical protein KJ697_01720 [Nanoarchaeota archaeon]|nr:hypothetical protein [Nanoarchaeota archaeon]MBU4124532.1 hypothetical protein [Nanoarchaeota archaeon]